MKLLLPTQLSFASAADHCLYKTHQQFIQAIPVYDV